MDSLFHHDGESIKAYRQDDDSESERLLWILVDCSKSCGIVIDHIMTDIISNDASRNYL